MATRKAASPQDKQKEVAETIATFYTKSVERLADAQKKSLDMALLHNAEVIGAWKKIAKSVPDSPIPSILDLAGGMFAAARRPAEGVRLTWPWSRATHWPDLPANVPTSSRTRAIPSRRWCRTPCSALPRPRRM